MDTAGSLRPVCMWLTALRIGSFQTRNCLVVIIAVTHLLSIFIVSHTSTANRFYPLHLTDEGPMPEMVRSMAFNAGCSRESLGKLLSDSCLQAPAQAAPVSFWGETQASGSKVTWLVSRKSRTGAQPPPDSVSFPKVHWQ